MIMKVPRLREGEDPVGAGKSGPSGTGGMDSKVRAAKMASEAGIPAVLTIEGSDSSNGNVHTERDTLDTIDWELALEIVRMNVA